MKSTQDSHPAIADSTEVTGWLLRGERGMSSEAMIRHLSDVEFRSRARAWDYPLDLDDFRRCEVALREVPSARPLLHRMAETSPEWARLVECWQEIVGLIEVDHPEWFRRYNRADRNPSLWGSDAHNLLRQAIGRVS